MPSTEFDLEDNNIGGWTHQLKESGLVLLKNPCVKHENESPRIGRIQEKIFWILVTGTLLILVLPWSFRQNIGRTSDLPLINTGLLHSNPSSKRSKRHERGAPQPPGNPPKKKAKLEREASPSRFSSEQSGQAPLNGSPWRICVDVVSVREYV
ncbi:MAG: hypothetical protein UBAL2_80620098 [Leptospirillum rubarum]|nr:MAG: hypothetical protein UBAL2_80620098 [Leptospirillum rubarum]